MTNTLVVLAAGLSSRFGGNKQLASVGPSGEALLDYSVFDALRAGFERVTFVIRRELERDFRDHVNARFGRRLHVTYAHQDPENLPKNRNKPWGTGHAILATRHVVRDPFVVINADDFYGARAYSLLYDHFRGESPTDTSEFAMIGYTLRDTFSPFGGVSRGICECDEQGYLRRLIEVKKIENNGGNVIGFTVTGDRFPLRGDEIVSMNMWGLTPAVFARLDRQFARFLSEHGDDPNAEFLLSSALDEQIAAGETRLKVIAARERWFGMTYRDDRENVMRRLATLVRQGDYPPDLTSWYLEHE